jgi:hypothetical protein
MNRRTGVCVVSKRLFKALDRWVGEQRDQEKRKVADNGAGK